MNRLLKGILCLTLALTGVITKAQQAQPNAPATPNVSMKDSLIQQYNYVLNGMPFECTLITFGSHYCRPCKQMESVLDSIRVFQPKMNVRFLDASNKANARWVDFFQIEFIPQELVLNKKAELVYRHKGYLSYDDLMKHINDINNEKD